MIPGSFNADSLRLIRNIALDLDRTIYLEGTLLPCTQPFVARLRQLGIACSFHTNNPSKCTADYLAHVAKLGLSARAEEIYSSTQATIAYLRSEFPDARRIFLLDTSSMVKEFVNAGREPTGNYPRPCH